MIQQVQITLPLYEKGFHLITDQILAIIGHLPASGILHLIIQHTSAGLTINENFDPTVRADFNEFFNRLVPDNQAYFEHTMEGPDDMPAHIKSSLMGFNVTIPIVNHQLNMGTWQGIYLCEFRNNGGQRRLFATIQS